MKTSFLDSIKIIFASLVIGCALSQPASAALCKVSSASMSDFTQYPLFEKANLPPVSMLLLSIDHQLFNKAYTDYTNLDGDPEIETTYDNAVDYSGYFGSNICYSYVAGQFESTVAAVDKKCVGQWSGNFLNWVTMTRLDVLRWVLYGGNRITDTLAATVLERAHIPQDGHSYVKIFSGSANAAVSDVTPFATTVSFCNTTPSAGPSSTTADPPMIQVAPGAWPQWTLIERYQCDYGRGGPPAAGSSNYIVRVKVCGTVREDFCARYDNGGAPVFKPVGLLQEYGQGANPIEFGLMTGSYDKPRSGGVLRSKIGNISSEVDQATGQFLNQTDGTPGVINTIRRVRMSQYTRDVWRDCSTNSIQNSQLSNTRGSNRKCSMWGNPISEIYAEAVRYFEGATTPTPAFVANDGLPDGGITYIPGMPIEPAPWTDPFANRPRCTKCNILVLSTGLNSFDRDEVPALGVVPVGTLAAAVNAVGANEGANTGNVLTGATLLGTADVTTAAGASFRDCSAKPSTGLSNLSGVCPEVGSLQGGYDIAGMAHRAFISDIRPEITLPDRQFITTYGIALGESLPRIDLDVGGGKISVLPFAQSSTNGVSYLSSSIVNFQPGFLVGPRLTADANICITAPTDALCYFYGVRTGNTPTSGSFIINWEDSTWGNDYDQDGVQVLSYCIGAACNTANFNVCANTDATSSAATIPINNRACGAPIIFEADKLYLRSEVVATAAGLRIRLGWITAGSDVAGAEAPFLKGTANCNFFANGPGAFTCGGNWTVPQVRAYTSAGTGARLLENPLYYAAKYGSFRDLDGDDLPDNNAGLANNPEWDVLDLQGAETPDGIPDNFFPVRNPTLLKVQLGRALARIASTTSSGTSAAVVSSTGEGSGAVFQATYASELFRTDNVAAKVKWTGSIRGLWINAKGKFAEDTNQDGEHPFPDGGGDLEVSFEYDPIEKKTKLRRDGELGLIDIELLKPIWDAAKQLTKLTDGNLLTNRDYTGSGLADDKRYIFTWLDQDKDGQVDMGEQVPFEAGTGITAANFKFTNTCSIEDSARLINWIRGIDQPFAAPNATAVPPVPGFAGLRPRQYDLDNDGTLDTNRLGDIVNSSPLVVAKPTSAFDILYRDKTYTTFANTYRCRRSVVYSGANDGMLHAFNSGFRFTDGFSLNPPPGCPELSLKTHAFGSELWAFVPGNLLPHLPWVTDPNYTHVFYLDGNPQSFDVKAFPVDADHPNGWGTILLVPFRLGGGSMSLPTGASALADHKVAPAYIILDVTNPESPPKLLAEVVLPNNSTVANPKGIDNEQATYSFGSPTLAFDVNRVGSTINYNYQLLFGSGPTKLNPEVHSNQKASVYRYDLNALVSNGIVSPPVKIEINSANTMISDWSSADFDFGGTTDAAYFGTIEGVPRAAGGPSVNDDMLGKLYKVPIESAGDPGLSGLIQPGLSFNFRDPLVFFDPLLPIQGKPGLTLTSRSIPGILFGTGRLLSKGDFSSSDAGSLYILDDANSFNSTGYSGLLPLENNANNFRLNNGERGFTRALNSRERGFTSPAVFRGIGVFTTFLPEPDQCVGLGQSRLFQINFANDANSPIFGTNGESVLDLGEGVVSNPRITVTAIPPPKFDANGDLIPAPAPPNGIVYQSTNGLGIAPSVLNDFETFGEQAWWEPREAN